MIKKITTAKSDSFSVEDIRELRNQRAELFKNMSYEQIRKYYNEGAERARKEIAELRAEKRLKKEATD